VIKKTVLSNFLNLSSLHCCVRRYKTTAPDVIVIYVACDWMIVWARDNEAAKASRTWRCHKLIPPSAILPSSSALPASLRPQIGTRLQSDIAAGENSLHLHVCKKSIQCPITEHRFSIFTISRCADRGNQQSDSSKYRILVWDISHASPEELRMPKPQHLNFDLSFKQ
jgi:hypothetical protein